jgi:hypothetical protein
MDKARKSRRASITALVIIALLGAMFLKTPREVMAAASHSAFLNEVSESIDAQEDDGQNNQNEVNSENVGVQEEDGQNNQDEVNSGNVGVQEDDGQNNQVDPGQVDGNH